MQTVLLVWSTTTQNLLVLPQQWPKLPPEVIAPTHSGCRNGKAYCTWINTGMIDPPKVANPSTNRPRGNKLQWCDKRRNHYNKLAANHILRTTHMDIYCAHHSVAVVDHCGGLQLAWVHRTHKHLCFAARCQPIIPPMLCCQQLSTGQRLRWWRISTTSGTDKRIA